MTESDSVALLSYTMSKLPSAAPARLQNNADILSAYNVILRLEQEIQTDIDADAAVLNVQRELNLICCRIIGHLFHHVPTDSSESDTPLGLKVIVQAVNSLQSATEGRHGDKQLLLAIGRMYYDYYCLRIFQSDKGPAARTPAQSRHDPWPSRRPPAFDSLPTDTVNEMLEDQAAPAPQDHAAAKKWALVRDGFRCVISGAYDVDSINQNMELQRRVEVDSEDARVETTECAYIFSEATTRGNAGNSTSIIAESSGSCHENDCAATAPFAALLSLPEELNGNNIHRLENVMTMAPTVHSLFDSLQLWLVPSQTDTDSNTYRVEGRNPLFLRQYPQVVTFTTPDADILPLPSPSFLAVHAAHSKVAHLSGAAAHIEQVLYKSTRDTEETIAVLAEDGASAEVLEHAIITSQY